MKSYRNFFPLVAITTFFLTVSTLSSFSQSADDVYFGGQLWVQFNPTTTKSLYHELDKVDLADFQSLIGENLAEEYKLERIRKPFHFAIDAGVRDVYQLFFSESGKELEFAKQLEQLDEVYYAERVPIMRTTITPNDMGPASGNGNQWFLHQIQAEEAWDISTGNTDIKVAIVDDAVLTNHPDLIPNLLPGYDVADNDTDAMPNTSDMSHGTHVAGISAAATNNGIGVASIGFNLKILPVKSSNSPQFVSDAYAGVVWAYQNDADVINMSWGGSGFSQTGQNIMNNAYNAGCVNVAAAGNDNVTTVFYPAGYNNVISVASTTFGDSKSSFSNYGSWVDISAPGSSILSTYIGSNFSATYASIQGTSMASPLVAGLCALVKSVNPDMTQTQIENCVLSTADNIDGPNSNYIGQLGAGRINAYQSVLCAQTTLAAPPFAVIDADNTVRCPGSDINFYGSSQGGLASGYQWSFPGGNPATSTAQNPVVNYSSLGNYDVSLTLTNQYGIDTETQTGYVEISTNGTDIIFNEDFENGSLTQNQWIIDNPDIGIGWDIFTVAGATDGSKAAGINLFSYNDAGQRDGLISPVINLSEHYNIQLDFQHAHRRYSQDYSDSLLIYVSTDGGNTFPNLVFAEAETGQGTFATNSILAEDFFPSNGIDWCFGGDLGSSCFTVDLSDFDGESNVRLRFETLNDYGNNIFIDNIQISGNCFFSPEPPVANFSISNENICAGETVNFNDLSSNVPTSYQWTFQGGTPASSTNPAPTIEYNVPGVYSVTLSVSNQYGSDEITELSSITVNQSPTLQLNSIYVDLCEGESFNLVASGTGQNYNWTPETGLSGSSSASVIASPSESTIYTVSSTLNGCTEEESIQVNVNSNPEAPNVVWQNDLGLVILNGVSAEGYHPYLAPNADWGFLPFSNWTVESDLVIARSAGNDSLSCDALINGGQINGNIAVIYRGTCEFGDKALIAQNAGAIGVIIINNEPGDTTINMGVGVNGASVTIPTIMVSANVGAVLNNALYNGQVRAVLAQFNGGAATICPGDEIRLAAPHGYSAYEWNNGDQTAVGEMTSEGQYNVTVYNEFGCESVSTTYIINEFPIIQPVITESNGELNANSSGAVYQWYLNGEPIGGNSQQIVIQGTGSYSVELTDNNGCISESDPYQVTSVGIADINKEEFRIWPNPASEILFIEYGEDINVRLIEVFSADGRLVYQEDNSRVDRTKQIDVTRFTKGIYTVRITGLENVRTSRFVKN